MSDLLTFNQFKSLWPTVAAKVPALAVECDFPMSQSNWFALVADAHETDVWWGYIFAPDPNQDRALAYEKAHDMAKAGDHDLLNALADADEAALDAHLTTIAEGAAYHANALLWGFECL